MQEGDQFRAQITIDLGTFPSAEEAALAHDRAAVWTLGIMASTNLEKRKQLLGHGTCERPRAPTLGGTETAGPALGLAVMIFAAGFAYYILHFRFYTTDLFYPCYFTTHSFPHKITIPVPNLSDSFRDRLHASDQ